MSELKPGALTALKAAFIAELRCGGAQRIQGLRRAMQFGGKACHAADETTASNLMG